MPGKLSLEDIHVGAQMETTFWANPVKESGYRYRAKHLDGRRAPKVVLSDDGRIRVGVPCIIRIKSIQNAKRADHGLIEAEFVRVQDFRLEGVYLNPIVSKKLQILLENGMNILLDGPQGCGKTVTARAIAEALGMDFVFFNCSAVVEPTDFLATIQVRASESGQPVTDFVKTEFLLALESADGQPDRHFLIFLDEFNRCQESARNALMPALDATRRIFNPVTNAFLQIPENVQFIAAVNRGSEFSATFGIDAAQLDRFAPLQMDYPPVEEEVKLLLRRHPELSEKLVKTIVEIADKIRSSPELSSGLSVRATDEACMFLKHPLMEGDQKRMLPEILKTSFCARFAGRWNDSTTDGGVVWEIIEKTLGAP